MKIDGVSYLVFSEIMRYLYTGKFEALQNVAHNNIDKVIEYLRVADKEYLDEVKMLCE